MSEWTPEDAARLREYAERTTKIDPVVVRRRLILRALDHIEKLEKALASHVRDASEPTAIALSVAQAARLGEIAQDHPDKSTLFVCCEPSGSASVTVDGVQHPLNPDPRIERVAEWLHAYKYSLIEEPEWSTSSERGAFCDYARNLLAAIDGEAGDE